MPERIRSLTIPETNTYEVSRVVRQIAGLPPKSKIIELRNRTPWQPDAADIFRPGSKTATLRVSRIYTQGENSYMPTDDYIILDLVGDDKVDFERITREAVVTEILNGKAPPDDPSIW